MIHVSQRSRDMLLLQKGELAQLMSGENANGWLEAYVRQLETTLGQVDRNAPFPRYVLDIGSGLGGIDALLIYKYACHVTMIDGDALVTPSVIEHDVPFCSRAATVAFMEDNNVNPMDYDYRTPDDMPSVGTFDLVMSFRSWMFHYGPEQYLAYVNEHTRKQAVMIVDTRIGKEAWRQELARDWTMLDVVERGSKYERIAYERR